MSYHNVETGFYGFGGTKKTVPELIKEVAIASEYMEKALIEFNEMRVKSDTDRTYYYEGRSLIKKIQLYKKRLSNRVDKLTIAHTREVLAYKNEMSNRQNEKYINPSKLDTRLMGDYEEDDYEEDINEEDEIRI